MANMVSLFLFIGRNRSTKLPYQNRQSIEQTPNFVLLSSCIATDRSFFYDIAKKKRSIGPVFRQDVW